MVCKCSAKNAGDTITHTGDGIISKDQQLANELHGPITKELQRCKLGSSDRDNI